MPRAPIRRDLFAADRGLQLRMVLTALLTPLTVLAATAAIVALAPPKILFAVGVSLLLGAGLLTYRALTRPEPSILAPGDAPELHAMVERLCAQADMRKPVLAVRDDDEPNSWTIGLRPDGARIHVTTGLLALLERDELEAVMAHELAHIAHRDAMVMTAVGLPGELLFEGGATIGTRAPTIFGLGAIAASAIGMVSTVGTRSLSRHRELAADAGAAALTGRPAALISALHKASGRLAQIPEVDLREAAARNAFNLLPAGNARWLMRTHPPLEARIARLERLEHALYTARVAAPD